ncbi:hypothetical protein POKO110462_09970 [Pontibacter korlensis]|uniref:Lipoprotein n=1 Tax=Pontibacter korlensis TaxID=400092 RepID=A0A0E3UYW8_9BACT|nr:hypothetical protein [Pontibacter korlensis]AKD04816.1 hypothetical protein PKOR_19070 [Pontibacter korlensis]
MRRALLLLVMLATVLASCEDKYKDPDPKAMGYEYYPLEIGDYRIYNVTDIRYMSDVGDTTRFQMRERVDTTFFDQTNTLNYKIIRSIRENESRPWEDDSVYVVSKSNSMVVLTKNNTKYVKLVFPVREGVFWLGDAYNDHKENTYEPNPEKRSDYYNSKEPYTYHNVDEPFTLNGSTYESSLTVVQGEPTESWIGFDDRKEVYVKDIGMVYRLFTRIIYCNATDSNDCDYGIGYKLHGHERHEELVSYGKE